MEVLIERRTETMTYARFDVGLFGSKSMGQLMVRQIIFEMTLADKFIRDWHPAEPIKASWPPQHACLKLSSNLTGAIRIAPLYPRPRLAYPS